MQTVKVQLIFVTHRLWGGGSFQDAGRMPALPGAQASVPAKLNAFLYTLKQAPGPDRGVVFQDPTLGNRDW